MASNVVGRALLIIFTAIFMTYKFPLERNVASKAKNFTLPVDFYWEENGNRWARYHERLVGVLKQALRGVHSFIGLSCRLSSILS